MKALQHLFEALEDLQEDLVVAGHILLSVVLIILGAIATVAAAALAMGYFQLY